MERNITVVVSEYNHDCEDCNCELTHYQYSLTLEELLSKDWFQKMIREAGYYNKDELYSPVLFHLDKFVYKFKHSKDYDYYSFTDNINLIHRWNVVEGVYQEVVGPEHIKAYKDWLKKKELFDKKEKDRKKKLEDKRKTKQIEKARKLLDKENDNWLAGK